jgi:hypothetical protein
MDQAHQQSSNPPHVNDDIMTAIIRSQYVHSLTLFLRSLPNTLTPAERLNLVAAIPQSVLDTHFGQSALSMTTTTQPAQSRKTYHKKHASPKQPHGSSSASSCCFNSCSRSFANSSTTPRNSNMSTKSQSVPLARASTSEVVFVGLARE